MEYPMDEYEVEDKCYPIDPINEAIAEMINGDDVEECWDMIEEEYQDFIERSYYDE